MYRPASASLDQSVSSFTKAASPPSDHDTPDIHTLAAARKAVEKRIKHPYFKSAPAPVGVKPVPKAPMELN